ncbi:MAG: hypothetical protein LBN42_00725 [Oscillospiraceae bacterium]|jgi:hypothetical protein|nr:hypothetical protein [Oscillospiraceae bacterium]
MENTTTPIDENSGEELGTYYSTDEEADEEMYESFERYKRGEERYWSLEESLAVLDAAINAGAKYGRQKISS